MEAIPNEQPRQIKRPLVLASIMLAMFLAAIEATIVSTAMPSIAADLGGFSMYSWVFSAYLLTNAGTVLIFGKLSDLYGRKPIFLIGITVFMLGSVGCGVAGTMEMLIGARFIQGIGAGALMPIATTIVGDIYTKEERAKIQGYLSSVWGISAVSGPALGGFFVDVLSWHYVFFMNIPLGLLAMAGVILFFHENIEKKKPAIDFLGSIWLILFVSSLLYILVEGGVGIPWGSPEMYMLLGMSALGFILFLHQERRAEEPMMPFSIWKHRSISIANLTSLTTGMILIGVSSYLPAFVQGVMERSATVAGFTLTTMSIGWPIAATLAGRLILTIGFRTTSILGGVSLIIGGMIFFMLSPDRGPIWAGTGSFFIGVGMGLSSTSFIVSIQTTVGWKLRGIATASNMFMRSIGSALGAALLGGILNNRINGLIKEEGLSDHISVDTANQLMDAHQRMLLSEDVRRLLQDALTVGLHHVYAGLLILAVLSFFLITMLPKGEKV
ncbi:EmrB/QacA subfamily drug resistance transporter [Melghiribacillus thermohalophilus]|uniref:EmrB/QacA subfamily drug resistance transporter n=2 Tax=Melghiribacillus thermohalophilus TaxID=1324956 RepID=A0A4R3N722_9BACI|nr:EmrB/QacA subfamily drug resistance transporter [Melghiribacillus thermohalophilus]